MEHKTNVAAIKPQALPALAMDETELMNVLRNSLYVGAQDESIKLVMSYCKASGLDPMQKPVHIVPMYASTGKKDAKGYDIKAMRDVIMPGIGLYRTQAARSGNYAGVSEPEFGPDVNEELGGVQISYPKWCKVIVKRAMQNGSVVEFAATEFWKENYATKGKDSPAPNSMWLRRPYGQIAKCAEAQALRKAFPEFGAAPTADEMEGKTFEEGGTVINGGTGEIVNKPAPKPELQECTDEKFSENREAWREIVISGKKSADDLIAMLSTKAILSEDQRFEIDSWSHEHD